MARPKLEINEDQVTKLAAINCSYAEMAAVLNCDVSTLTRRFAQVIEKGRESGKMSLKRKQYEVAMGGNTTMLIWLGKQILGQKDQIHQSMDVEVQKQREEFKKLPKEEQALLLEQQAKRIRGAP